MRIESGFVRAVAAAVMLAAGAGARAQSTPATPTAMTYAPASPAGDVYGRRMSGSAWGLAEGVGSLSGTPAFQSLALSPKADAEALLTLSAARVLTLSVRSGGAWGSAATMVTDTGTAASMPCAGAYETQSGKLLVVYRSAAVGTGLVYRADAAAGGSAQTYTISGGGSAAWVTLTPRPGSNDAVMLMVSGTTLSAAVWNGSSWGNSITLTASLPAAGTTWAAAPLQQGKKVMVVWAASSGAPSYRTWDGTAWSASGSIAGAGSGLRWVSLAGSPLATSNEAVLATIDSTYTARAVRWDGSVWGNSTSLDTNTGATAQRRVDAAWQRDGTRALVAWHRGSEQFVRYRSWTGAAWGAAAAGASLGSMPEEIMLAPGSGGTDIACVVRRIGTPVFTDYVMYSSGSTVTPGGTTVHGQTGQQVSGVTLPAAPTNAAGSTNISLGNNQTQTIAPGAYGTLTVGNNCTLNFSAGDYVFKSFSSGNNPTLNCNTSGGNIRLIFTTGGINVTNNLTLNTTGTGTVSVHVVAGNATFHNNTDISGAQVYVYAGNISMGNNTDFTGAMYASGSVSVGSGTVSLPSAGVTTGPGMLTGLVFSGGSPGAASTLCAALPGTSATRPFDLAWGGAGGSLVVTRWREVSPEE